MQKLLLLVCAAALACSAAPPAPTAAPAATAPAATAPAAPHEHDKDTVPAVDHNNADTLKPTSDNKVPGAASNLNLTASTPTTKGNESTHALPVTTPATTNTTSKDLTPAANNETVTTPASTPTTSNGTMPTTTASSVPMPTTTNATTLPASTNGTSPSPLPTNPPTVTTTEQAKVVTTPLPVTAGRGFDGASFIGGIVLALGLLAMGFMGFKYYKTQTERNYHTL